MKKKMIDFYMDVAKRTAELSHARRFKVGAIIVKDENIISFGYNGTPAGEDNNCEDEIDGVLVTKPNVIHAEANCFRKVKSKEEFKGAAIFLMLSPCINCAKLIHDHGISEVYYDTIYRSTEGLEFLKEHNVRTIKV